jgi:hypothetical protein
VRDVVPHLLSQGREARHSGVLRVVLVRVLLGCVVSRGGGLSDGPACSLSHGFAHRHGEPQLAAGVSPMHHELTSRPHLEHGHTRCLRHLSTLVLVLVRVEMMTAHGAAAFPLMLLALLVLRHYLCTKHSTRQRRSRTVGTLQGVSLSCCECSVAVSSGVSDGPQGLFCHLRPRQQQDWFLEYLLGG